MRVGILGTGVVGSRIARLLVADTSVEAVGLFGGAIRHRRQLRAELGAKCFLDAEDDGRLTAHNPLPLGRPLPTVDQLRDWRLDVIVCCLPDERQVEVAELCVEAGVHVVTLADSRESIRSLLTLNELARDAGVAVVAGAGTSPGLSVVLARHAIALFDSVDSVAVAVTGTAGPECAIRRTAALKAECMEWRGGEWVHYVGSPGTELLWFPDPIGSIDCGRGDFSETLLLRRAFPAIDNLSVKAGSVVTGRHRGRRARRGAESAALRVEVQGRRSDEVADSSLVYGVVGPADLCSATVAVASARAVVSAARSGAGGVGDFLDPVALFRALAEVEIRPVVYEGIV